MVKKFILTHIEFETGSSGRGKVRVFGEEFDTRAEAEERNRQLSISSPGEFRGIEFIDTSQTQPIILQPRAELKAELKSKSPSRLGRPDREAALTKQRALSEINKQILQSRGTTRSTLLQQRERISRASLKETDPTFITSPERLKEIEEEEQRRRQQDLFTRLNTAGLPTIKPADDLVELGTRGITRRKTLVELGTEGIARQKPPTLKKAPVIIKKPDLVELGTRGISKKKQSFFGFEKGAVRVGRTDFLSFLTPTEKEKPLTGIELGLFAFPGGALLTRGKTAAKILPKAITAAKATKTFKFLTTTKTGQFLGTAGKTLVAGEVALKGTESIGFITTPKEQKAISNKLLEEGVTAGFRAEETKVASRGFLKQAAFELTPFFGNVEAFKFGAREFFKSKGLTGLQLETAIEGAVRKRKFSGIGEGTGFLVSSAAIELGGKGIFKTVFKGLAKKKVVVPKAKAGGKLFLEGFKTIAPLGFIEGGTQEFIQQQARRKPFDIKQIGLEGVIGAGSAGLIGGGIIGLQIPRPGISKGVEIGSFIVDPFEKPGDIIAGAVTKVQSKITKKPIIQPKIFEGVSKAAKGLPPTPVISFAPIGITQPAPAATPAPTAPAAKPKRTTVTKVSSLESIVGIQVQAPTFKTPRVPVFTFTPISIFKPSTPVPIGVPVVPPTTPTTIQQFGESTTEATTTVATTTVTGIPIIIPVITPQLRIPPPIPLLLPFGSFGGGVRKGKKLKFISELAASQALFKSLVNPKIIKPAIVQPLKRKRRSKRK